MSTRRRPSSSTGTGRKSVAVHRRDHHRGRRVEALGQRFRNRPRWWSPWWIGGSFARAGRGRRALRVLDALPRVSLEGAADGSRPWAGWRAPPRAQPGGLRREAAAAQAAVRRVPREPAAGAPGVAQPLPDLSLSGVGRGPRDAATEAMGCGAALCTYDNGGCRDYAIDGRTAVVLPRRIWSAGLGGSPVWWRIRSYESGSRGRDRTSWGLSSTGNALPRGGVDPGRAVAVDAGSLGGDVLDRRQRGPPGMDRAEFQRATT